MVPCRNDFGAQLGGTFVKLAPRARLGALGLAVVVVAALPLARAEASPGPLPVGAVTLTAVGGSSVSSGGAAQAIRTPTDPPECSDGIDNESGADENGASYKDAKIDFPADPQCTSATDDSETIGTYSGFGFPAGLPADPQPVTRWSFPATVSGTTLTVPQAGFTSPVSYARNGGCTLVCANYFSKQTLLATGNGTGTVGADGSVTIDQPVKAQVLLVRGPGSNGLAPASQTCETPTFTLHLTTGASGTLTGSAYDAATGQATLVDGTYAVPALAQTVAAGTNLCTNANTSGGLPSASGSNRLTLVLSSGAGGGATTTTTSTTSTSTTSTTSTSTTSTSSTSTTTTSTTVGNPNNATPVANAGADILIGEGVVVKRIGTATDTDTPQNQLSYSWTQISGPAVVLTGANTATVGFTAPDGPATLVLSLRVSDGNSTSVADSLKVSVLNKAPVVNAGVDRMIASGANVSLAGTATDVPGDPLVLQWTQTSGPAVTLIGPGTTTPAFTAPAGPADLAFTLRATDDSNAVATDSVVIRVSSPASVLPTPNAGLDIPAGEGTLVKLKGTATDPDTPVAALTYRWVQTSGPVVVLTTPTSAQPTFTAPGGPASLTFDLYASDTAGESLPDSVKVSVLNKAPVVNAGVDRMVASGAGVSLAGTATDVPGDVLGLSWTQTSGPHVTLSGADTAAPSFTAPAGPVDLAFTFTAKDDSNAMATDTVVIRVSSPASVLPTPNAGADVPVFEGAVVKLKGTATDPDTPVASLTYRWVQTSGPVVVLTTPTSAQPTFTAPDGPATLTFDLYASDPSGESLPDSVKVSVLNKAPLVSAGAAQTVASGATVTLSGTATDVPGDPLTLLWTQTAGPAVALSGATTPSPTFTAPTGPAVIDLSLTATDDSGAKATATVRVTVSASTGTIKGKLTYVTFVALDGATVTIYNANTNAVVATTTTALDGTYSLDLPAGPYKVGFSKAFYTTEYWKDQTSLGAAQVVNLTAAGTATADGDLFFGI